MAQSGNWFGNLFMWFIGAWIMYVWNAIYFWLNILGLWQMSLDTTMEIYKTLAPPDLSDMYTSSMSVGGQ